MHIDLSVRGLINNSWNQVSTTCSKIVDYWCRAERIKRDFDASLKCPYKVEGAVDLEDENFLIAAKLWGVNPILAEDPAYLFLTRFTPCHEILEHVFLADRTSLKLFLQKHRLSAHDMIKEKSGQWPFDLSFHEIDDLLLHCCHKEPMLPKPSYIITLAETDIPVPSKNQILITLKDVPSDFPKLEKRFEECFSLIDQARQQKRTILIQCRTGESLGPALLTAYMMERFALSFDKAHQLIKAVRSKIELTPFALCLQKTEREELREGLREQFAKNYI